ncbi:MAG: hypothetical protein HQL33_06070, partial [Alphaproteobacteria bacterium]|nr:hypothetical protein [Alphaproteobacteria bacterium]
GGYYNPFGGGGYDTIGNPFGGGYDPFGGGRSDPYNPFGPATGGDPFGVGMYGPYDPNAGALYGDNGAYDPYRTYDPFTNVTDNDDDQTNTNANTATTVFERILFGTAGNDELVGPSGANVNFYFAPNLRGGTDVIQTSGVSSQISFDQLANVKIKLTMSSTIPRDGVMSIWNGDVLADEGVVAADSSITFHNIAQYMFSTATTAMASDFVSGTSADSSQGSTSAPPADGDIIRFKESLALGGVGYMLAGTDAADGFTTSAAYDNTPQPEGILIFGRGGGDTFAIDTKGDHMIIGGATAAADNVNGGNGYPTTYINHFDYSGQTVHPIYAYLYSVGSGAMGGDASITNDPNHTLGTSDRLMDQLWDVGALTATDFADTIRINGGTYYAIDGGAGNDTILLAGTDAKVGSINGGAGTNDIVAQHIYTNGTYGSADMPQLTAVEILKLEGMTSGSTTITGINTSDHLVSAISVSLQDNSTMTFSGSGDMTGVSYIAFKEMYAANDTGPKIAYTAGTTIMTGMGGSDTLTGTAVNDILFGGYGNDTLYGGAGSDVLIGGWDSDTMTGGVGHDVFYYSATGGNIDHITDFAVGGAGDKFDMSAIVRGGTVSGTPVYAATNPTNVGAFGNTNALQLGSGGTPPSYDSIWSAKAVLDGSTIDSGSFYFAYLNSIDNNVHVGVVNTVDGTFGANDTAVDMVSLDNVHDFSTALAVTNFVVT